MAAESTITRALMREDPLARRRRLRYLVQRILIYTLLVLGAVIILVPFLWMISTSLKVEAHLFDQPPQWIPKPIAPENYVDAWKKLASIAPGLTFWRIMGNTLFIIAAKTFAELLSVPLVAYGFARLKFPGKKVLFLLVISTMMIPLQTKLIPLFTMYVKLGLNDTYWPLILPAFTASPFFIFLLNQYMKTLPRDLDDAAKIDGVGTFGILYRIILPLCIPALTIIVVYTFLWTWNEFLQPLIYLSSYEKFTIQLGLEMFKGIWSVEWNLLMAATLATMSPVLIMYFFAQKRLIGGIASVGLKG